MIIFFLTIELPKKTIYVKCNKKILQHFRSYKDEIEFKIRKMRRRTNIRFRDYY